MLEGKYDFLTEEKKWEEFWKENEIYNFDESSNKEVYSIDTPPPTVNGKIHIGHIFSYSQAEMMARYKRMRGYNVFYPFGFDDNGLPTERLVEKEHKIKAHEVSREEFTNLCLQETDRLEKQFKELFIRAGFSNDWNYEYSTISPIAQKTSQKSFIELAKNGNAYYKEAPALWCNECNTAIAQAELETKEIETTFNYLKFYLKDSDEYIEIATTRPELLPACNCIFINPEDDRAKELEGKLVRVPLFDFEVPIMLDEKVEKDKGTGIVMCCTFGDLTDLEWYKKYNLTFKEAILPTGKMSNICGKYEGLYVTKARKAIIEDLAESGLLIKSEKLLHNVATHERCGTPMEITIKNQWFIDVLSNKEKFLELGYKINWYPQHMKVRYTNWVENLQWDWCISRQRYFGIPFPVWYCKNCGKPQFAEEKDLPVNPLVDMPNNKCQCGCNDFEPERDILDTWATSSCTPLINSKWANDDKLMEKIYPMSLRPNAHDIIRTWDFYTIVKSLYHTNTIPWKNVMISGHVLADKNEKISKKKGNSKFDPIQLLETYSADVTRYWAATGSLGADIIFSEEEFKNGKKLVNKIWNASKFVLMHLENYKEEEVEILPMDRWIIAKYNEMLEKYIKYLEKYEIGLALNEIERFFWNFCDNYIEIVKNRLYKPEIYGEEAKKSGQIASYKVLFGILKCFSIYMPHITEKIYQEFFKNYEKEISIHQTYIDYIKGYEDENIVKNGDGVVDVITQIRKYKSEKNISIKEELQEIDVVTNNEEFCKEVEYDIKATCNCLNIVYKKEI